MKQPFAYSHPRPALTVDVVLFRVDEGLARVLLIQRKHEPFAGKWAFPGGFVDEGETLKAAAGRELKEETGARCETLWPVAAFGDPGRDPRGWTVSAAYYGFAPGSVVEVRAGDDAASAEWKRLRPLPRLAFDHAIILRSAVQRMRRELYLLPIARPLLPRAFSLAQLAGCYRALDPRCPEPRILRRRLEDAGLVASMNQRGKAAFRFRRPISQS